MIRISPDINKCLLRGKITPVPCWEPLFKGICLKLKRQTKLKFKKASESWLALRGLLPHSRSLLVFFPMAFLTQETSPYAIHWKFFLLTSNFHCFATGSFPLTINGAILSGSNLFCNGTTQCSWGMLNLSHANNQWLRFFNERTWDDWEESKEAA